MIGVPLGILACRLSKTLMYLSFAFMIYSLVAPSWSITFLSREMYKAGTRGFEVHIADLIAVILCFTMLFRREEFRIRWMPPLLIPMLLYFAVGWISWSLIDRNDLAIYDPSYSDDEFDPTLFFEIGLYPLFELSKIGRGIFIFWVCFNFLQDKRAYGYFVGSFCAIVLYLTASELYGRYILGQYRPDFGGFQFNDINTFVGLASLTVFPLAFVVRSFYSSLWYWFIMGSGFLAILITVSRSSMVGFVLGAFLTLVVMLYRYPTARNLSFLGLSALVVFMGVIKAADTLFERFTIKGYESDIEERTLLNESALLMGNDHLFGVGLGNFSAWQVNAYAERIGAVPYNIPHNIWFLTIAEVGYPGLVIFVLIWIRFYQLIFSSMRIFKKFSVWVYGYPILLGILSASILIQFQNRYHFTYRQTSIYFIMHILMAIAARAYYERRQVVRKYALEHEEELQQQNLIRHNV